MSIKKKAIISIDETDYFSGLYCVSNTGHCFRKNHDFTLEEVHNTDFKSIIKVSHYLRTILDKYMLEEYTYYVRIIRKYALTEMKKEDIIEFRKKIIRKGIRKILEKDSHITEREDIIDQHTEKILNFNFGFGDANNIKLLKQYQNIIREDLMLMNIINKSEDISLPSEQSDFLRWCEMKKNQRLINLELGRIYRLAQNGGFSIPIKGIGEKIKDLLYATIIFLANKKNVEIVMEEKIGEGREYYLIFHYQQKKENPTTAFQQQLNIKEETTSDKVKTYILN